jgi:glycosyltransferase involved in cell wall biosynthesis
VRVDRAVVVIPAHNEAVRLPACLTAVRAAAAALTVPVLTVLVLDACTDDSAQVAARFGVQVVAIEAGNVGSARAAGFAHARSVWPEPAGAVRSWYATTDADSRVDPDWLQRQTAAGADIVLGVVRIADWRLPASAAQRYLQRYRSHTAREGDAHTHIHGANMGFTAEAYWAVGGFAALSTGEDVDLVRRFEKRGLHIRRDAGLSVVTSARRDGRAPNGFAAHLRSIGHRRDAEDPA